MSNHFYFNSQQFERIFPFFIKINRDLIITDLGKSILKFGDFKTGISFQNIFSVSSFSKGFQTFAELFQLQSQLVFIKSIVNAKIQFRGQFEFMEQSDEMLFLGSPIFDTFEYFKNQTIADDNFLKTNFHVNLLSLLKNAEINNHDLKALLDSKSKYVEELEQKNNDLYNIALFPKQNPDPNIRINYEGDVLQNNPAASNLDFIDYDGKTFRNDIFFKHIVEGIDKESKRWSFEAGSNKIDYSFDCVAMPQDGYINIYGRDITQQKINQKELEKLSLIVQQTMNAVIITNADGNIDWVNKSFEKLTGFSLEEVKGIRPGFFLQGKDTNKETVQYMKAQIKKCEPFTCEILNYKKSGEMYWLRINGQPIFDSKGNLTNFFAIEEDITLEKQSQEKIKAASSRMYSLISNLQSGILLENDSQKIEFVNDRFCEMFNIPITPEQMIGFDFSKMAQESKHLFSDPENFENNINALIKNKSLVIGEQLTLINGNILERSFIPIWNEGNYEGHLWMYSDITEKITANKKMEDLRIFYEKILDNIPSDIAVFDKEHHYLYVNPTGIKDAETRNWIIGKRDEDYIQMRGKSPLIFEKRRKLFNDIIQSKQLKSWEEELKQLDGTSKFILRNMYPLLNNQNEVDLVIGYGVDITDIKLIQQQKEDSEKKYKEIIDNSLAIITTHDMDGKFLNANPMIKKIFGYTDEEFIGHYLTDFMIEEDKKVFNINYLDKIKIKKEATGIFRVLHKDGHIVYTLYNNYLKEELGKEPYVIGFAVDISKRILVEKELKKAKKVTEELANAKHNFLANMSHEIRTPMNAIMGMSRQLSKSKLTEEQKSYLDNITNASENLLVIINDVLDLAKLEAGKLSIEKIGFELKIVIKRALQVMMHKAEEKGIELINTFFDSKIHPILLGDPFRINQILLNVISNAIKFTAVGGVKISCSVLKDEKSHQEIEIKVVDTGIGMEKEFLYNLFQKFSQEYKTIAKNYGGTGLGMSITKSLLDNMNGKIIVESEKNKGTEMMIRIRFEKGTAKDLPKKDNQFISVKNLKGKKILVVDDNLLNRMVATFILKEYEVQFAEAGDGLEAINFLKNNECDLVLMDIQMPVLNGIMATKAIREELKLNIPIIALTANAIKGEKEKCLEAGMSDYLSKPFEEEQFLHKISFWVEH